MDIEKEKTLLQSDEKGRKNMHINTREKNGDELKGMLPSQAYFRLWAFMRVDLDLTGAELMIYSIIYSYFRNGDSFTGSHKFLACWTGYGLTSVNMALTRLVEKKLIAKGSTVIRGRRVPEYTIVPSSLPALPMHENILSMCKEENEREAGVYCWR